MRLKVLEFSAECLPRVQHFECGSSIPAEYAAAWIKAAPSCKGALHSIREHGNSVWLYYARQDLVGFSSLGTTRWRIPPPDGPRREAGFLPMLAVATQFQGKACGRQKLRYSDAILSDTIKRARERGFRELCLFVHADNARALRLYQRHEFQAIGDADERGLLRMLKLLD